MKPHRLISPISFLMTALICAVLGIIALALWTTYRLSFLNEQLQQTQQAFATSTALSLAELKQTKVTLTSVQAENKSLSSILNTEQRMRINLEQEKAKNVKQIDTLTKLTTIDPELLKKYSKIYFLSENYAPPKLAPIATSSLANVNKPAQVLENIAPFVTSMIKDAKAAGIDLLVVSAYRSFGTQSSLKATYKLIYGAGTANQFSADQGYSEHQLGTAIDFGTPEVRGADLAFDDTAAFNWLSKNAYKYGFIISYPKANTFYEYEPWHWRFIGRKLATDMHNQGNYFYELDQRLIDSYLISLFD